MCPKKTRASEPGSQNRPVPWEGAGSGRGALGTRSGALTSAGPDSGINKISPLLVKIILHN